MPLYAIWYLTWVKTGASVTAESDYVKSKSFNAFSVAVLAHLINQKKQCEQKQFTGDVGLFCYASKEIKHSFATMGTYRI